MDLVAHLRESATDMCVPDGCCYAESMVKAADEIERLRADKVWLSDRLHDAVNTCYGGITHDQVDACSYEQAENK